MSSAGAAGAGPATADRTTIVAYRKLQVAN